MHYAIEQWICKSLKYIDAAALTSHKEKRSNYLIFSDGGKRLNQSAALGWVVFACECVEGVWLHECIAYEYRYISTHIDSMTAEALAFEAAVDFFEVSMGST